MSERPLEQHLRYLLQDFGRALSTAISESSEVHNSLRRIRSAGYSLYLLVDSKDDAEVREQMQFPANRPGPPPEFQVNSRDVSFLRSIGIDATRRPPRRRSSS